MVIIPDPRVQCHSRVGGNPGKSGANEIDLDARLRGHDTRCLLGANGYTRFK